MWIALVLVVSGVGTLSLIEFWIRSIPRPSISAASPVLVERVKPADTTPATSQPHTAPLSELGKARPHTRSTTPTPTSKAAITKHAEVVPPSITAPVTQGGNGDCQANAIGGSATVENCGMPDPYKSVLTYGPDGTKRVVTPNNESWDGTLAGSVFIQIGILEQQKRWSELLLLSEEQKRDDPNWFTLDYAIGEAHFYLCDERKSRADLEKFLRETTNAGSYAPLRQNAQNYLRGFGTIPYLQICDDLSSGGVLATQKH